MALIPYDPLRRLENMRRDLDHFFQGFPTLWEQESGFNGIRTDLYETETEVVAKCDIPGLEKKDDLRIEIQNNMLTISGSINKTEEMKEKNMVRTERFQGNFRRSISLPTPVAEEGIKATYKNGVLEVRMPKLQENNIRQIDVDFH